MKFNVKNKLIITRSYRIDGSSHYSGIKNEDVVLEHLKNEYKNGNDLLGLGVSDSIQFIKKGTTKHKADIIAITDNLSEPITISVKRHSTKSGTLDYLNTSKLEDYIYPPLVTSFRNLINEVKKNIIRITKSYI
ncbi:MAG: hypothetical protein E7Y34_00245 [Mycoplasma sp.]|nr:hypothetical protein [Mycoplasma sp.]